MFPTGKLLLFKGNVPNELVPLLLNKKEFFLFFNFAKSMVISSVLIACKLLMSYSLIFNFVS